MKKPTSNDKPDTKVIYKVFYRIDTPYGEPERRDTYEDTLWPEAIVKCAMFALLAYILWLAFGR